MADFQDARGEALRAAVLQVVPIYARDDDVPQAHALDRERQSLGLSGIERVRGPVRHGAVGAVPRADIAQDHEGRRAVLPAFAHVGTVRFFAHRMQPELPHHLLQRDVVRTARRRHPEPRRLPTGKRVTRNARRKLNEGCRHRGRRNGKIAAQDKAG